MVGGLSCDDDKGLGRPAPPVLQVLGSGVQMLPERTPVFFRR